jgi:hypothetical protein
MKKPTAFEKIHQAELLGKLTLPDRILFRGHLKLRDPRTLGIFLKHSHVMLKDFGAYAQARTAELKAHAERLATEAGRPFLYLSSPHTARTGYSKEELARDIARRDRVREGLICVLSTLEPCNAFDVQANHKTHRLQIVRRPRKCLHFYFYFLDPQFGFMHVRLQSWLPFTIQIYVNGREWLCRQLDRRRIGYQRYDNALVSIDDLATATRLSRRFMRARWPPTLDRFAYRVNPLLESMLHANGYPAGYYWVTEQCEIATDLMFRNRPALAKLLPDLLQHSLVSRSAEDALRFLGRKPNGHYQGEATADLKRRPEGMRIKFRMKRNSIKMYDKWSVLRIETTIHNPREFKILRRIHGSLRWLRMAKGVANFWRLNQIGQSANARFLEALASVQPTHQAVAELDRLSRGRIVGHKRIARFNPVSPETARLFAAALHGRHLLNGFRNRDLASLLHPHPAPADLRRRRERTSRLIAKLRGHGLIAKVTRSRLYRVTPRGHRFMSALLTFHHVEFPQAFAAAA